MIKQKSIKKLPTEIADALWQLQEEQWRKEDFFNQLKKEYFLNDMPKVRKAICELRAEMGIRPLNGITRDMIEEAKKYPIANLIGASKKKELVLCINHKERHPSMWIKNNYAYCFGCHWHGDSISVYMLLHEVSFKETVRELCGMCSIEQTQKFHGEVPELVKGDRL